MSAIGLPLHVVGCSHETADAGVIGRISIAGEALMQMRTQLHDGGIPSVLLSTCNRTELYWWGQVDATPWFSAWLASRIGVLPRGIVERRAHEDAVRHLFSMAAGLKSQRLGEPEILGQTRQAWLAAREHGVTVQGLDRVFERAIQAGRRIRARAGVFEWGRSLGEAAAAFISDRALHECRAASSDVGVQWADCRVVVVGTGAAAESAAVAISERSPQSVRIVSRTDERARTLAARVGASPVPWGSRLDVLAEADVIIFATRSKHPVVPAADVSSVMHARRGARAVWLDLGVPRNVEPLSDAPHNLSLYALSDLALASDDDATRRDAALSALDDELARYAAELERRASRTESTARAESALREQPMALTSH